MTTKVPKAENNVEDIVFDTLEDKFSKVFDPFVYSGLKSAESYDAGTITDTLTTFFYMLAAGDHVDIKKANKFIEELSIEFDGEENLTSDQYQKVIDGIQKLV